VTTISAHENPKLVFNLDEVAISDWEDFLERNVIVPSATKRNKQFMRFRAEQVVTAHIHDGPLDNT
jgi:hypothetical protein